ncbi:MAG: hypothetical protein ABSG01_00075 [Anaerolineales bacterium]|jgi:hypothetical protein
MHGIINVGFRKFASFPKLVEKVRKSSGQRLKHAISSLKKQLPEGGTILAENKQMVKEVRV